MEDKKISQLLDLGLSSVYDVPVNAYIPCAINTGDGYTNRKINLVDLINLILNAVSGSGGGSPGGGSGGGSVSPDLTSLQARVTLLESTTNNITKLTSFPTHTIVLSDGTNEQSIDLPTYYGSGSKTVRINTTTLATPKFKVTFGLSGISYSGTTLSVSVQVTIAAGEGNLQYLGGLLNSVYVSTYYRTSVGSTNILEENHSFLNNSLTISPGGTWSQSETVRNTNATSPSEVFADLYINGVKEATLSLGVGTGSNSHTFTIY